jgi:hypothetical protein
VNDLNSPFDNFGYFAPIGTSLANAPFSAQFIFDTGLSNDSSTDGLTFANIAFINTQGAMATMTINGHSASFDTSGSGFRLGSVGVQNDAPFDRIAAQVTGFEDLGAGKHATPILGLSKRSDVDDFITNLDPTTPFSYSTPLGPSISGDGLFTVHVSNQSALSVFASLDVESVTVSSTGTAIDAPRLADIVVIPPDEPNLVPEPAQAALLGVMVMSLGLARRRAIAPSWQG